MIVSQEGKYGIIDLPKGPVSITPLDLSGMEVRLDRAAEWKQIYRECWRQMRDFFYDPRRCTAWTGRRCATATSRSSPTSRTGPICLTSSAR